MPFCAVHCANAAMSMTCACLSWPVEGRYSKVSMKGVWLLVLLSLFVGEGGSVYSVGAVVLLFTDGVLLSLLTDGEASQSTSMALMFDLVLKRGKGYCKRLFRGRGQGKLSGKGSAGSYTTIGEQASGER